MKFELETDANENVWAVFPHHYVDDSVVDMQAEMTEAERVSGRVLMGTRYRVPPKEGVGIINAIRVSPHLYVMIFDVEYHQARHVHVPGDRMVKVRIVLSGALQAIDSNIAIEGAGAYLEAYPGDVASSYILAGGVQHRLVILMCHPGFFSEELGLAAAELPQPLRHLFDFKSGAPLASATPLGPDLLRAANDIRRSAGHYAGNLYRSYLNAKGREIACTIVRELTQTPAGNRNLAKLTVRDVNRVHEARDILADQYRRPPTIPVLARQVGLNQTKLKAAFKLVFGLTLNDFTLNCRMERGSELLTTTNLSVAEIAYAMGYNHPANFTHAFRRFYGHAPRQLRKAITGDGEVNLAD